MASFNIPQTMLDHCAENNCVLQRNGVDATLNQVVSTGNELAVKALSDSTIINSVTIGANRKFTKQKDQLFTYSWRSTDTFGNNFIIDATTGSQVSFTVSSTMIQVLNNNRTQLLINNVIASANSVAKSGDILKLEITDNNYQINSAYFIDKTTDQNINFTISSDKKTATLTYLENYNIDSDSFNLASGIIPPKGEEFTVTKETLDYFNSNNSDLYFNSINSLAVIGDVFSSGDVFIIKPRSGYLFRNTGNYFTDSKTGLDYQLTLSNNVASLIKNSDMTFNNSSFNLNIYKEDIPSKTFTVDSNILQYMSDNNATLYKNGNIAVLNDVYTNGDVFNIKTNDGYQFIENSVFIIDYLTDVNYYFDISNGNDARLVMTSTMNINSSSFNMEVVLNPVDTSSVNKNYYLTKQQYDEFTKQVYNIVKFDNANENVPTPITDFLVSCRSYPFKISDSDIAGINNITIRESTLNQGYLLKYDVLEVNFGDIIIPRVYNNALDFINVDVSLFIPYSKGSVSIPNEFIGKTFNVTGKVIISSGVTTITLTDLESNITFDVYNVEIGSDFPFFTNTYVESKNYEPSNAINNIDTAYVIINTPNYSTDKFYSQVRENLSNVKGFVSIENMEMNVTATYQEIESIKDLFKTGVIING